MVIRLIPAASATLRPLRGGCGNPAIPGEYEVEKQMGNALFYGYDNILL
jgi:hypothetical protein